MKVLLALAAVALLAPGPDVRFEENGVRVGDGLVTGQILGLKESGPHLVLVSGSAVESLGTSLPVAVAPERTLLLEPGVRVSRTDKGYTLSTHGRRFVGLRAGELRLVLESPVALSITEKGWAFGEGRELEGATLAASLQQEQPDQDLESMKESARKIEQARTRRMTQERTRPRRIRSRRVFGDDPSITAESIDTQTLRFLPNVSPE